MAPRPRGICSYCGEEIVKQSIGKHLDKCAKRQTKIAESVGTVETLVYLRAECAWDKKFFIDLEVRGSAKLIDLDEYLRAIWLECCGHMSEFRYERRENKISMSRKVDTLFEIHKTATHIYDMGTTSETLLTEMSVRQGVPTTENPIVLLARNKIPEVECEDCEETANWLCIECLYENSEPTYLCNDCVEPHGHTEEYGPPIFLVNSPRLGMCGYDGPAVPPY
jgi:hypothetical protein